ncbi:MAG TPA: hypothetical protein VL651_14455 [Bacteroidia bacterium]|jgi:hypothetical protein|nr:hypothetical protein [Bacteroidia bacterium]
MKQVTVTVENSKYKFFMELMKSLGFVHVSEKKQINKEKEKIVQDVVNGMIEAKQASKGKLKSKSAQKFLNEL